ncbi:MAG: proline--tRNA ligase [bacterium (Candidatus Ratteibacteria) CG_4_10_14_3_um_filter_41_18]|uniref:Proline--tRNA ligase n=4 Tax=Candidatus Ratteibacteria TaxID=2979319 RepID=A0A2M7E910_9BACT|nr:MAG: proline--tRNA ligase [Candidatus Omnitrophica bacterium CG1_02_41_171]PIV64237.1 MAG: proline--tRNA ligase [bacterium (Candidatus Ratteibacteria) CG01_land_8_20_14_3_00_40_19]PIW33843.1 MAG: proline--tRNA ligase [bacterium (Candidatus Ratteibacteria) CG15_BIG_FIL_POST_REV_8_21_14_020_41_12]PIW74272.1 MAG: proline--tRNA ligase [bacterium (Candidatus Ratteibacteria) CG_4_8_14_3_um_filter_41_36]PIX76685.1 MAG: proline--tRNA ligase [bacterium (Candidatus Ratteibacteria) CG_4_10_14_3_um_filt
MKSQIKWSEAFIRTLKETPKEAETISHKLMLKAGLISKVASGVYSYLPLGLKVLRKIEKIVREEIDQTGACELLLPALQPESLWKESGRISLLGKDMINFIDRHQRRMFLGPTHEEVIIDVVRKRVHSWKELPIVLYQIQTKFRDEVRPRFGVVRAREFLMKDAYSFDADQEGLDKNYEKMREAYELIFKRCGIKCQSQKADSGIMGGRFSEEFVAEGECKELEIGHIFKLGDTYSKKLKLFFLDKNGEEKPMIMGCYGIGISRLMAAIIEGNYDEDGLIWPRSVSPYSVLLLPMNMEEKAIKDTTEELYRSLQKNNIDVIMDDRIISPGIKFKDGDLLGIPFRILIGKELKNGKVELKLRREKRTELVKVEDILQEIKKLKCKDYQQEHENLKARKTTISLTTKTQRLKE